MPATGHGVTEAAAFAFGYGAQAEVGLPAEALAEAVSLRERRRLKRGVL